jgi:FkbM family methyltransferase
MSAFDKAGLHSAMAANGAPDRAPDCVRPRDQRPEVLNILRFIASHPLTRNRKAAAVGRLIKYQIATRTRKDSVFEWIDGAKLVVARGMTGASGNIYCGLHEFADMGFFLHFLRSRDLFLDIGANIGSYTILASKLCSASTIAFEPDPDTAARLACNVKVNEIGGRVMVEQIALAERSGTVSFSVGLDSVNHITDDGAGRQVTCETLDSYLAGQIPIAIKMDVEGAESRVLAGASRTLASPALQAIETEDAGPAVVATLEGHGFSRAYYDPFKRVLSHEHNGYRASNALFLKDMAFCQERVRTAPRRKVLPGQEI